MTARTRRWSSGRAASPSLWKMLPKASTVRSPRYRVAAMERLDRPSAISLRTSRSRKVRPSRGCVDLPRRSGW